MSTCTPHPPTPVVTSLHSDFWFDSLLRPRPEPRLAPPESGVSCAIKRRLDGGLDSEVNGKRGQDIYFMGIIDILQVSQLRGQLHECMGYVSQFSGVPAHCCCVCTPGLCPAPRVGRRRGVAGQSHHISGSRPRKPFLSVRSYPDGVKVYFFPPQGRTT